MSSIMIVTKASRRPAWAHMLGLDIRKMASEEVAVYCIEQGSTVVESRMWDLTLLDVDVDEIPRTMFGAIITHSKAVYSLGRP